MVLVDHEGVCLPSASIHAPTDAQYYLKPYLVFVGRAFLGQCSPYNSLGLSIAVYFIFAFRLCLTAPRWTRPIRCLPTFSSREGRWYHTISVTSSHHDDFVQLIRSNPCVYGAGHQGRAEFAQVSATSLVFVT